LLFALFADMFALLLRVAITPLPAGPEFVTHDCARGMPRPSIAVSPSLCRLVVDRPLFAVVNRVYQPRPHRSPSAVIVALLLLLGGVECNPSPFALPSSSVGLLNARSASNKAALIHDVITDNRLDILILTETRIPSDAPDAVKLDVAPPGYAVVSFTATAQRPLSDAAAASPLFTATPSGQHQSMSAISVSSNHSL